ncbi:hypothetical protein DTX80_17540 [Bacilli bacterium]|uniref:hypothetical protein n=1 Tax=Oceanobacillus TaxID=182709 RepID=UPI00062161A1|nr:hypothetical protein WH51_14215 [Bacilli bacterium VT-13-104]PZD83275.1 hypothetical protein DEJ64_15515 [Bacilli bacterium]PZD84459.1 hypothetical protein DEJ60_14595 [Bacilli bacterium]PZD86673.1 hypothetical protein DEJ66_15135 [Bacilli bacterium]RCO04339.1 hypothetical protein DTX80_17540 [Bacilli bacterium]
MNKDKVVGEILEHSYKDKRMKKQVFIACRTKNKRIKNKAFTKLFYAFMKENPVKVVAKIESVDDKYYYAIFDRFEYDLLRIEEMRE